MSTAAAEPSAKIRVAIATTPEECEAIYRFRYSVYVEEMGKECQSYADHSRKLLSDPMDEHSSLFYAESNGRILGTLRGTLGDVPQGKALTGYYQLPKFGEFKPAELSFTSRLMIDKAQRRTMALPLMLNRAYEFGLKQGVKFDFCNCTPALVELYEHLGYRRYGVNFHDPEVGYRVPLVMMPRDAEHLKKIRSPFWRMLRRAEDKWDPTIGQWFKDAFPHAPTVQEWTMEEDDFWSYLAGKYRLSGRSPIPLLEGLTEQECGEVMRGTVLHCEKGDTLMQTGDVGTEIYVVLTGGLEVKMTGGESLASFGPGQIIGEIAGLLNVKRTADVVATMPSEVLVLNNDKIQKLRAKMPSVAATLLYNLATILAQRLVASTQKLSVRADAERDEQES